MRPTFITGFVRIGKSMRQASIRRMEPSDVMLVPREYVALTVGGATFDPWAAEWRTLRLVRNSLVARLHDDGRLSTAGPSMFAFSTVSLTKRDGTLAAGKAESFDQFVEHMLNVGADSVWHGETYEDRINDAVGVLTQEGWLV